MLDELKTLVETDRFIDAVILFAHNSDTADDATWDLVLSRVLPRILSHHATWLINNPRYLDALLNLCEQAHAKKYRRLEMTQRITHLRCYKAVQLASEQKAAEAQTELLAAAGTDDDILAADQQIGTSPTSEELSRFFILFFDSLRSSGREDLVRRVRSFIENALRQLGEDERRLGVVRGLFVSELEKEGLVRLILVDLREGEGIEYQRVGPQSVREDLEGAAEAAYRAADAYLKSANYPEGLSRQKVVWQIVKPDLMVEDQGMPYDGASLGLALAIAILSAYVRQVIPADVAFTGAFDIHSAGTGEMLGVGGVPEKLRAAYKGGIRRVYLPLQNYSELDLAAQKMSDGRVELRPVENLRAVTSELIRRERRKGFWAVPREVAGNVLSFFGFQQQADTVTREHAVYALLSSTLFGLVFFLEGLTLHKVFALKLPAEGVAIVMLGAFVPFTTLLACYALPIPLIERGDRRLWYLSILLLGIAVGTSGLLLASLAPPEAVDTGPLYDWPPYLAIFKDVLIFYVFGFFFITNFYNFVVATEYLLDRRQFHTAEGSLTGKPKELGMLPTAVFRIDFRWAVWAAFVAGLVLLLGELIYFYQLRQDIPQNAWIIGLGLARDGILVLLAVEVLIWYQMSQTKMRIRL